MPLYAAHQLFNGHGKVVNMRKRNGVLLYRLPYLFLTLLSGIIFLTIHAIAQDTVTGAFDGVVIDKLSGAAIKGATVELIDKEVGKLPTLITDPQGQFFQALLRPGTYTIRVVKAGYQDLEVTQELPTLRRTEFDSMPDGLEPAATSRRAPATKPSSRPRYARFVVIAMTPKDESAFSHQPAPPAGRPQAVAPRATVKRTFEGGLFRLDGRRDGAFRSEEVMALPLGGTTLVRAFDELATLLPGVAPPPQTIGNGSGPGVGAGVGSSGQFAVNGLRSRANNFTVDGSDNNDEDIGVRRQGFLELIPQPVESVQEYQVITLLAPAQFGRNLGAQVNAVSRSGGGEFHGTLYGMFNSSQLNARNPFDTNGGDAGSLLFSGGQPVVVASGFRSVFPFGTGGANINRRIFLPDSTRRQLSVRDQSGGEDSLTLGQGGFVLGGPIRRDESGDGHNMFFFVSAEGHALNATEQHSFAVPTVTQRGLFGSGATARVNLTPLVASNQAAQNRFLFPASPRGDAVFSLFPFANNPEGVYGANTFTQQLPADAHGAVLSGKFDSNFRVGGRQQAFTARYNFTNDFRTLPATGGALFSTMQARVRTQNLSLFLNTQLSRSGAANPVFNQVRLSYGRTRLVFDEIRDRRFLLPSNFSDPTFGSFGLLNAPLLENLTSAQVAGASFVPNTGDVFYLAPDPCNRPAIPAHVGVCTTEDRLGPIGQVIIAGFSPVGIDVFNFPQRRVNNTYQFADQVTMRRGPRTFTFGADNRRTELNSDLPRNARTLLTFNGSLPLPSRPAATQGLFSLPSDLVVRPEDLAAAGAASGSFLTLAQPGGSATHLRFYQWNFFAQDEWRVRRNLSLSYGLRYEYNTPPREVNRLIESTFDSPDLALIPGLRTFLDGRTRIYDPDRDNFAPRVGLAFSKNLFGRRFGDTNIRAGYGLYYDQIIGAVVSQSRNVFPSFLTLNLAGGNGNHSFFTSQSNATLGIINPADPIPLTTLGLVQAGTLNQPNALVTLATLSAFVNQVAGSDLLPGASGFGATLPARRLETPRAYHYALTVEQQLGARLVVSVGYVGTQGRQLLRFTTPNLGPNAIIAPLSLAVTGGLSPDPGFFGVALPPGTRFSPATGFTGGRPVRGVGVINLFETSAMSGYDALQLQARGRFRGSLDLQLSYTLSKAIDDVSDVFDLAGASALPQDSFDLGAERAPANFDVRQRFAYNFVYDLPVGKSRGALARALLGGARLVGAGRFRTGQPFTVNSIFDVNLDGNLTDRLNTTDGLIVTGNRQRPLSLAAANTLSLLAPVGQDGQVGRNTFRAGNVIELDIALDKRIVFAEQQSLLLRVEAFNFINRANYGVPVRFLEAPTFGQATETLTPGRRVQIVLKYSF
jgi:hypothetical protein